MNETSVTKLKDQELIEIKDLQSKIQETIIKLGKLQVDKMDLDAAVADYLANEKSLKEHWTTLQRNEKELLQKILTNYGEGSLNIVDGTFSPSVKR